MADRSRVRSSARLNGDGASAGAPAGAGARSAAGGRAAQGRGRPVSSAPEAALRRARAAERAAEVEDSPRVLRDKCRLLARALRNAKHLVVYTGAGISTAADIPDYRGPDGVWTRLQRGETVGRVEVSRAQPTFTHMALTALWARGALKFVVSQNCDGLHLRAGLPRRALAELHGDMFVELCAPCRRVYLRAFDVTQRTARHQHATRRLCHACGAELRDSIVHFGERGRAAWPLNWAGALRHAARADVVLCLGSSLKVLRRYPRLWRMQAPPRARPALYIVNLQWTPKDSVAALKINARCDAVMRQVARRLRLRVPRYRAARDPVLAHAEPLAPPEAHTSRRPLLRAPASPSASASASPSASASDSDEELPLRHLAARLRRRPTPSPSPASPDRLQTLNVPTDQLHAFQVSMESGEATILLRAEHASPALPRAFSSASSPRAPPSPPAGPRCRTAELRKFRMLRRLPDVALAVNGHAPPGVAADTRPPPAAAAPLNGTDHIGQRLRRLLEYEPRIDSPANGKTTVGRFVPVLEADVKTEPKIEPKTEPKMEPKTEPKIEPKTEPATRGASPGASDCMGAAAGALAAAIIRRAVLLCRASLYPGLHSIIAPPPPPDCAWCARHFAARRCLWYGPARAPPLTARAWRRVRGRRYLCACCGPDPAAPVQSAQSAEPDADDGGWYGKGYRKGRRRRR